AGSLVIVIDAPLALLLLGERDVEVEVELVAERRGPRKRPPQPPLVRLKLNKRRPRHRPEHHAMIGQVNREPVESVRDTRAGRAPRLVVWAEHEVVDEELRAPAEEICQPRASLIGIESILLVHANPRQVLASPCQFIAAPR